jgi:hypothetical protein
MPDTEGKATPATSGGNSKQSSATNKTETELTVAAVVKAAKATQIKVLVEPKTKRPVSAETVQAFSKVEGGISLVTTDGQRHLIED